MTGKKDTGVGDLRKGTFGPVTFPILRYILLGICKVLFRMDVRGTGNIPKNEGCIVAANHLHNADPLLICIACPRPLHFMAKAELMTIPVLGRILRWAGGFPVNRGKADRTAIKRARATVQQGIALGMFPEGTRSTSLKIERVLPGAGLVATQDKVKIIPCTITGTERLPFNDSKQHKRRGSVMPDPGHKGVRITFGEAFLIPEEIDGKRANATAATDYMMQKVAAMLPEAYRGIYGTERSQVINIEE